MAKHSADRKACLQTTASKSHKTLQKDKITLIKLLQQPKAAVARMLSNLFQYELLMCGRKIEFTDDAYLVTIYNWGKRPLFLRFLKYEKIQYGRDLPKYYLQYKTVIVEKLGQNRKLFNNDNDLHNLTVRIEYMHQSHS